MKATEMKTLVINGELKAAGSPTSLLRYARKLVRKNKLENPSISLIRGMIFKLEDAV